MNVLVINAELVRDNLNALFEPSMLTAAAAADKIIFLAASHHLIDPGCLSGERHTMHTCSTSRVDSPSYEMERVSTP